MGLQTNYFTSKLIFIFAITVFLMTFSCTSSAASELDYVDLNNWSHVGNGNWLVEDGGRSVLQTMNSTSTFFLSTSDEINVQIKGTIEVKTTADDDMVGFVLGYDNDSANSWYKFILFDWKQYDQTGLQPYPTQYAYSGYSLGRFEGVLTSDEYIGGLGNLSKYFWFHEEHNDELRSYSLLSDYPYPGRIGWLDNTVYSFEILYTTDRVRIFIDDVEVYDVAGTFDPGKLGFYNYSQEQVNYGNVQIAPATSISSDPIASSDRYGMQKGTTLTRDRFSGLLFNDYDPNLDPVTIVVEESLPSGFSLDPTTGAFNYSPSAELTGSVSFSYHLLDDQGNISNPVDVTVNIIDGANVAPSEILLDDTFVEEGYAGGTVVGSLTTLDDNTGDVHDHQLIENAGGRFKVSGDQVVIQDASLIAPGETYSIIVRSTDFGGESIDQSFLISIDRRTPLITNWPSAGPIIYGERLESNMLTGGAADVPGTFNWENPDATYDVGMHQAVVRFIPSDTSQYKSIDETITLDIIQRPLVLTGFRAADKVYDGGTFVSEAGFDDNRVSGDELSFTYDVSLTTPAAGADRTVQFNHIELSGTDAGNYALQTISGTTEIDIAPFSLTLSGFTAEDKVYDGSVVVTGAGFSDDRIVGDTLDFSYDVALVSKTAGIDRPVMFESIVISGEDASNYVLVESSGQTNIHVVPRSLSLFGFSVGRKVYDGSMAVESPDFSDDRVSGDQLEYRFIATYDSPEAGLEKEVVFSDISLEGADALNYDLITTGSTVSAEIEKRPLVLRAKDDEKTYGELYTAHSDGVGYSADNLVSDDRFIDVQISTVGSRRDAPVGDYALTIDSWTGEGLENYEMTIDPGTLTIYRKTLKVTVEDQTISYGDAIPHFEVKVEGFEEGENAENARDFSLPQAITTATLGSPVGTYPVSITGGESSDYRFEITSGAVMTIEKMFLDIRIDSKTKRRGELDPDWTVTYTPALEAHMEMPALSLSRLPGESPGVYPITTSAVIGIDNYANQIFGGSLTILPSDDSALSNLHVDGQIIRPLFDSGENRYELSVDESVEEVSLSAETTDPLAQISIDGSIVSSGSSINIALDHGVNAIEVVVTAEDRVSTSTYWLTITRSHPYLPSSEARLSSLSVTPGSLMPFFSNDQKEYLVTVDASTDLILIDAQAVSSQAAIQINDINTTSGAVTIALEEGTNSVTIRVTAEDEKTTSLYQLVIHRERVEPIHSLLSALWISDGVLTPSFDADVQAYTVEVDASIDSLGLRAATTTSGASITIAEQPTTSSGVIQVALSDGMNIISIVVSIEGGEGAHYDLLVVRPSSPELSQDASLIDLMVERYDLDTSFDPDKMGYLVNVPYEQGSISFQAIPTHYAAKLWISDDSWIPGEMWSADLLEGENLFEIRVEAQDSAFERVYRLMVIRQISNASEGEIPSNNDSSDTSLRRARETQSDLVINTEPSYAYFDGRRQIVGTRKTSEDGLNTRLTMERDLFDIELTRVVEALESNDGPREMVVFARDVTTERIETRLTAEMVKELEEHAFHLVVDAEDVVYDLPAKALSIDRVAQNLYRSIDEYESIEINVRITRSGNDALEEMRELSRLEGVELLIPPVSFEVIASTVDRDGKKREEVIRVFSEPVKRSILIPESIDPQKVTTAVVVDGDGQIYHVPTRIYEREGQWYAEVNSLTNSDYTLIAHLITLESLSGHWSYENYEEMASRMVVESSDAHLPDVAISRSAFAEYLLRALGISHVDLKLDLPSYSEDHRPSQVEHLRTMLLHDLMPHNAGDLRAADTLTRLEAISIFQRALTVLGHDQVSGESLERFEDLEGLTEEELKILSTVVSVGVFNGTSETTLSPKKELTHAETVTALRNLLVQVGYIDRLGSQRILSVIGQDE